MDDDIILPDDDLAARLTAMEASRYTPDPEPDEAVPEPATEAEPVQATDTTPDSLEAPEDVTEPSGDTEEDDLFNVDKRLARAAYEKREAVREAKRLAREVEILRGTVTLTHDEAVSREAQHLAQEQVRVQSFNDNCNRIAKQMDKAYGSKDGILKAFTENFPDHGGIPQVILESVIEAGDGQEHKILHFLSKNLDLAEQIMGKTPAQQGVAIAKIAAKVSAPNVSKAPPPIKQVAGSASTTERPQKAFDKMSMAEKMEFLNQQDAEARRKKYMH